MTMYAHIDCNNFYASCHRVFDPRLRKLAVVVLSNQDGCVIARSDEAKALGIPMGAEYFKYKDLFKKHNVQVFSAKFSLYGDMSNRVMNILKEYSPQQEIYSVDEIFLKLNGFQRFDLKQYGLSMKKQVEQWTGIPICVGIAPTKSLAKVANKIAKKYKHHTGGVHVINSQELITKALKWTEVGDIWGVGNQYSDLLKSKNVKTAQDFIELPVEFVKKKMGIVGKRLQRDLSGISTLDLEITKAKKNIATTRSFDKNYTDYDFLKERIVTFTVIAAEKLRRQNSVCKTISVFIQTNPHRPDLPQYKNGISLNIPFETNSTIELIKYAVQALNKIFIQGYAYKRAGIILQDIVPEHVYQYDLFTQRNEKHIALMRAIDEINQKQPHSIRFAAQDMGNIWKMNQAHLCPSYTTNINEIITVKL